MLGCQSKPTVTAVGTRFTIINFLRGRAQNVLYAYTSHVEKNILPFAKFSPHLCLSLTLHLVSTSALRLSKRPPPHPHSRFTRTCNGRRDIPAQANDWESNHRHTPRNVVMIIISQLLVGAEKNWDGPWKKKKKKKIQPSPEHSRWDLQSLLF